MRIMPKLYVEVQATDIQKYAHSFLPGTPQRFLFLAHGVFI